MDTPIQGSCGDIFKLALFGLHIQLVEYDARAVNLIHDEFIVEVSKDQVEEVKGIVHEVLVKAGEYFIKSVPVVVDLDIRERWAQ
jgi:DNA polymerase I-like protein with 3'-5' exonuclease and polymerase domains